MKRSSTLPIIGEMQIKIIMRCHLTKIKIAPIEKAETNKVCYWWEYGEIGTLVYCWWELKMVQPLWKRVMAIPQKMNNRVTIHFTSRYTLKRLKAASQWGMYEPMFMTTLFTIAKIGSNKCPSTDEWRSQM